MSKYTQQAEEFMVGHGTTLSLLSKTFKKHFPEDKEPRHVYTVRLERNNEVYTFKFGQSIRDTEMGIDPTAYDILACLTKYDAGTFEDFCLEFGYDEDSRKAYKVYEAVLEEYQNVERLFHDVMDELREIQ